MAAVKALAAVAQKLFSQNPLHGITPNVDRHQAAADMQDHVIEPLLAAMEDYSTDNRFVFTQLPCATLSYCVTVCESASCSLGNSATDLHALQKSV